MKKIKNMVTYFNKKDLVNFGKYLLSDERTASLAATESEIPLAERLKNVYHSDVENFLAKECKTKD